MSKKTNALICDNIFKEKEIQKRKIIFTRKVAEYINQLESSTSIGNDSPGSQMYDHTQANRLVPIKSQAKEGG